MISRSGIHGIRALCALSRLREGEYAGASTLAKEIEAPENYLGKLLQSLARTKLVESRKGARGGFRLARDPARITLFEIVDAIENIGRWNGCFLGRRTCSSDTPCSVHDRWAEVKGAYLALLSETTVAGVAEREDQLAAVAETTRPPRAPRRTT